MIRQLSKLLPMVTIGILLVLFVFIVAGAEAEESATGVELNGLYWGDGDYLDYHLYSESEPGGRGFIYIKEAGPNLLYTLVRVSWMANDNAFSPSKPNQAPYLASVGWRNPHDLGRLIGSDHLSVYMECGAGDPRPHWTWTQDLLYDADLGPAYDWRSDNSGPDGLPVTSPTNDPIPGSGIVVSSYSSLEYNLENSSWIFDQQNSNPNNNTLWMSPDLDPLGTISTTSPMTDVNAITGLHEDYPFFMSTGAEPGDLYEWEISYEMLIDVSHCNGEPVFIGVNSAHNSPPKEGTEDIVVPTAIRLTDFSASESNGAVAPILIMTALLLVGSVIVFIKLHRNSQASRKDST